MTRSLITPVLLAVLVLGATACGGSDDPDDASATPTESTSSAGTEEPTSPTSGAAPSESTSAAPSESAPVPGDEGEDGDGGDEGGGQGGGEGSGGGGSGADDVAVTSSMQASLDALVDRKTTPQQKADRVVGGDDLAPVFQQFEQNAGGSQVTFTVEDPVADGRDASALVGAFDRGRPIAAPARTPFVLADGEWRLERSTVCLFAESVGLECPPR